MMTAFPYARAYIEPGSLTKPIFFVSADGDGILLPIKIKQEVD
jgi:hypothetical protein